MDRIDKLAGEHGEQRSESFDLGYFDAEDDLLRGRPYDDGADKGVSEEYRRGYKISYEAGTVCPHDGEPLSAHIGGKPCTVSPPSTAKNIWDLPVFGWAWKEDGRDRRA